ncbi:MAG: DUF1351 domain-containing protein [Bacilli bacterium]
MEKPILENEIQAKINGFATVEDNISEAKEYALKLKEYYSTLVFTDEQIVEAKGERASINKVVKKIADYRKNIIVEFKKPIELFETTAKETEKILKETADFVDVQVKNFENKEKKEKRNQVQTIFDELIGKEALSELINLEMVFDERYLNKTYSLEKVEEDLFNKIRKIADELTAIKNLNSEHELALINMYLKDFDLSKVIVESNRLEELKKATVKIEEKTEEIKQEKMVSKKVEIEDIDPVKTYTLKITGTLSQQRKLKQFLDLNDMTYERVE